MENMRKMVLFVSCGVGTKDATAYLVPSDVSQEDMNAYAWEAAREHGQSFGVYPESEMPDDWDEEEHDSWLCDSYTSDIEGWFEDYDADKHDGQLIFGLRNDFEWNDY